MPLVTGFLGSMLTWGFTTSSPSPVRPTTWGFSLHTANPGNTGTNELVATGYSRITSFGGFTVAGGNISVSNTSGLTWTNSGGSAWSTVSYIGLWDAASSGNFIGYTALVQSGATYALVGAAIESGGVAYVSGDVGKTPNVSGGTFTSQANLLITAVTAGAVTGIKVNSGGAYSVIISGLDAPTTGGGTTGTGLTIYNTWAQTPQTYTLNPNDQLTISAGQAIFEIGGTLNFTPV